jgi:hypothetical protein
MRLTTRKSGILLWGVQGLLAALFLFAGVSGVAVLQRATS